MASIKVQQDVYGFQPKHGGFTERQIKTFAAAGAAGAAGIAFCLYTLRLPALAAVWLGALPIAPIVVVGLVPLYGGMFAEQIAERSAALEERGPVLVWEGAAREIRKGELTNEYLRASRRKGFECGR